MDWFWISSTIIPLAGMATGLVFLTGVYRLASKWMDRKHPGELGTGVPEIIAQLDQLHGEIEQLRNENAAQLEEMNERLDFAERLLANPDNRPQGR